MGKKLLIVESPAKAKTIGKYLGSDFVVKSSVGHIRDLPAENGAIKITPDGDKHWSFVPTYVISEGKQKVVGELKAAVKDASEIYLASDPDREGEAIAWHLREVLSKTAGSKPFHRVTYNEITKTAVLRAVAEPRDIDMPRVDAQQARRILDRLVGYRVSPFLWKQIQCANNKTLSAGRVQSVALRLLVERQREIDAFKPVTYFILGVEASKKSTGESFVARLARIDGEKPNVASRQAADAVMLDVADASLEVTDVKKAPRTRHALPPFTTSTLQQAASSVLGISPGKAMKIAQALYERGFITYMRTDSVNVSDEARAAARTFIIDSFGEKFYPEKPNFFKSKADAQGAHEAIRPTDVAKKPADSGLEAADLKLYDLIWRRFIASQMSDAKTTLETVELSPRKPTIAHDYRFTASATSVDFEGFLKVMKLSVKQKPSASEEGEEDSDEVAKLPRLSVGESLQAMRWLADEKQTKGPAHYSEASLIKALEENGVGRPSTYAATIETLKTRAYAKTEKRKLVPIERGMLVCDWLVSKLDSLFNVGYTAQMEAELDRIEEHGRPMNDMLSDFYAKFLVSLSGCKEPPPSRVKFQEVFKLLSHVKEWNEPKKVGRRTYDDKAFVDSVIEQAEAGEKELSARQLECLVRLVLVYENQIPNASRKLKEFGLAGNAVARGEKADPELVTWTFGIMDRIDGLERNPFLHSLRDQVEHGRGLSPKQFSILAKAVGDNASMLEDSAEIRAKLADYVTSGFNDIVSDPAIAEMLKMMSGVSEWRAPVKRGRKVYDDKAFVESLKGQFARRHSLSPRQTSALRRVVLAYRAQIPGIESRIEALGLNDVQDAEAKKGSNAAESADTNS